MPHTDEQNRWIESKARGRENVSSHQTHFLSLRCQIVLYIFAIAAIILSCIFFISYFGIKL